MSDIICARCGEPWDSTGGLHYTHSDLEEDDYQGLLEGAGCPCCRANLRQDEALAYDPEIVEAWRRSVERLAEGVDEFMFATYEKEPTRVPLNPLLRYIRDDPRSTEP